LRIGLGFVLGFVWRGLKSHQGRDRRFVGWVVGEVGAEGFEVLEVLDGAAMEPFGLGLVAEEDGDDVGLLPVQAADTLAGPIGAGLLDGDFEVMGDVGVCEDIGLGGTLHGFFEAVGEEAGLEGGEPEDGEVGEGDAINGEALLGSDGAKGGGGVGAEVGDELGVFDADDGILGWVEGGLAGVLGGSGLAFGRAGAGGFLCVEAIGDATLGGEGFVVRHG
jgi:hypothetical protein